MKPRNRIIALCWFSMNVGVHAFANGRIYALKSPKRVGIFVLLDAKKDIVSEENDHKRTEKSAPINNRKEQPKPQHMRISAREHATEFLLNKVASKKIARKIARSTKSSSGIDEKAKEMLAETAKRLARLEAQQQDDLIRYQAEYTNNPKNDVAKRIEIEREQLITRYSNQSANALKAMLQRQQAPYTGRKPDLAARLAQLDLINKYPDLVATDGLLATFRDDVETRSVPKDELIEKAVSNSESQNRSLPSSFASIYPLSAAAACAIDNAGFSSPSPIQKAAIPLIYHDNESVILHAETGSGKTLAYILPITERLWAEAQQALEPNAKGNGIALILTPTRELATQVAGVASVLAPPGTVRLLTQPSNLMQKAGANDVLDESFGGITERRTSRMVSSSGPRIIIGSAKSIQFSLYGDGKMPASPTPKPLAKTFLQSIQWIVLDEVDRLLNVKHASTTPSSQSSKARINTKHEKPAAILTAAAMRNTMGRCQVIAASATVGRPLRRELSRILGLSPQECPRIVRGDLELSSSLESKIHDTIDQGTGHVARAVTIPTTVKHYIYGVKGKGDAQTATSGALIVSTASILKALPPGNKCLVVLCRQSGLSVSSTVGALQHFGVTPQPTALLDVLQGNAVSPDGMLERFRKVSGSTGMGPVSEAPTQNPYLLVTGEDSVRGLHLEGLDTVIAVGPTEGPDEYAHVAGRTGRAGQTGSVINVLSEHQVTKTKSWEKMLMINFHLLENLKDLR